MIKLIKVAGYSRCGSIEFTNILLPSKRIVCPQCDGTGKHVNPSIDGHGLTSEDFAEDPDFAESYFSGAYDVRCELCNGNNVIDEIDENACKTKLSWYKGLMRHWNAVQLDRESDAERYFASEYKADRQGNLHEGSVKASETKLVARVYDSVDLVIRDARLLGVSLDCIEFEKAA